MKKRSFNAVKKNTPNKLTKYIIYAIVLALIVFVINLFFGNLYWTGEDKLTVAVRENNDNVSLIVFDPLAEEITTIVIPGNTQVTVARGLGVWKLGSVWDLGFKEGMGGSLLTQTLTKHLKFPVYVYADESMAKISSNNPINIMTSVMLPSKTNLSISDKVSVAIFSLKVKNANRSRIMLAETTFLKATTLTDGGSGYLLSNLDSPRLFSIFNDFDFVQSPLKIGIKDGSGIYGQAEEIGKILEILGSRASSIVDVEGGDYECEVVGNNRKVAEKISRYLDCSIGNYESEDNYDVEIKLGKNFVF